MRIVFVASTALLALTSIAAAAEKPACAVGLPVISLACVNYPGHIVAQDKAKGTWRVRCDRDKEESWVTAASLSYSCTATAVQISETYFLGKWDMFTGGGPTYTERNGNIYRGQTAAVKTPPLTVNADGTYVWVIDSKTTVRGRWRVLTPAQYKYGPDRGPAILLVAAEDGKDWQLTRGGTNSTDNRDRVDVERMDLGLTYRGTRIP